MLNTLGLGGSLNTTGLVQESFRGQTERQSQEAERQTVLAQENLWRQAELRSQKEPKGMINITPETKLLKEL